MSAKPGINLQTRSSKDGDRKPIGIGLAVLATAGLVSLLAAPVERLVPIEAPVMAVRALAIVQPAILTAVALMLGLVLAPRVGLGAPYLAGTEWIDHRSLRLRRDLGIAVTIAVLGGLVLLGYETWSGDLLRSLDPKAYEQIAAFSPPLITRLLYGGLTEEVIARWGLMTLFVWLLGFGVPKGRARPAWTYWAAATLAGLLFAAGHLPLLYALLADPPTHLIVAVIALNTLVGVVFGWAYWKAGIETAMLAHLLIHGVAAALGALVGTGGAS
jgi:membrane protease YdiL (CAAX protease family)